jgi:UDP-N-acetylmuramate dehydrogenase
MNIESNKTLAPYTSFNVGGPAEHFSLVSDANQLIECLQCTLPVTQLWILGYGSNSLISDNGLLGMTICIRGGAVQVDDTVIVADAGAWWDDVVTAAIKNGLWGVELLSAVPGSVGAALYINIAAYGQSIGEHVAWIEVWDRTTSSVRKIEKSELEWGYKSSIFQDMKNSSLVIIRAAFSLSKKPTTNLTYQKALDIAAEMNLDTNNLESRRKIIIEARSRAGSLWNPSEGGNHTVGSFFRNPVVSRGTAEKVMSYDESGKALADLKKMNQVHGGDEQRVSAAHVMLAAGFKRGQVWGHVKLNDKNLLKIEALKGATAQEILDVSRHIQDVCKQKLGVELQSEARILGEFLPPVKLIS